MGGWVLRCGGLKKDLAAGFFYFDFSKGGEERCIQKQ